MHYHQPEKYCWEPHPTGCL